MASETDTNFKSFLNSFPTVEQRHEAAVRLAGPNGVALPDESHITWDFLAAHWGAPEEELKDIGRFAWTLKDRLPKLGDPVAVVKNGTTSEIFADKPELDEYIDLTFAYLAGHMPIYGFSGNTTHRGAARLGIRPPFLGFGIALSVRGAINVKAGMLGEYTDKTVDSPDADKLLVYFGATALHISPDQYPVNHQTRMRELILGRDDCFQAVEMLRAKTSVTAPRLNTPDVAV